MKEKLDNFLLFIKTNSLLENKLQAGLIKFSLLTAGFLVTYFFRIGLYDFIIYLGFFMFFAYFGLKYFRIRQFKKLIVLIAIFVPLFISIGVMYYSIAVSML